MQVFLRDLSNVMLLDKDLLEPSIFSSEDKKEENRKESGSCDDDCFNKFYDQLTARKDDKVSVTMSVRDRDPGNQPA
jgi:hypothetical protein